MKVTRVYKHIRQISPKLTFHMRIEYQWTLGKYFFICIIENLLSILFLYQSLIKIKNIYL